MTHPRPVALLPTAVALLLLLAPAGSRAQQPGNPGPGAEAEPEAEADPIASIDAEFRRKFRELERERLGQLAELASTAEGPEAARVLETYLRDALNSGLFEEAEPLAERLLEQSAPTPVLHYLAEVVNIMAEADRGDFEASYESIVRAVAAGNDPAEPGAAAETARRSLPASARLSLLDTYHQRLVQAGQYETARKAFEAVRENALEGGEPEILDYLASRIQQLDMVGRPAPAFQGVDVDGRPVRLEDFAGRPVVLVFWATWYRPNADQVAWMKRSYASYRDRGLQIVGVNLDALVGGGRPVEEVLPEVRRDVLEYNLPWPNLVNVPGEGDIAQSYGVTEIPASVLIDAEGRIAALDLNQANFDREVEKVLGGGAERE